MLLMILVQNMSDTTLPGIQALEQTPTIVVITQSLLYFSLFSTLFAALLIVCRSGLTATRSEGQKSGKLVACLILHFDLLRNPHLDNPSWRVSTSASLANQYWEWCR
jgi:hypothetical protein